MERLAILGASGHGKVVADAAVKSGWKDINFFDDAWPNKKSNGFWSVVGGTDKLLNSLKIYSAVIVAIGDNEVRLNKIQELFDLGATIATIIHPDSSVSPYAIIEAGTVVFAQTVINADASLGMGCIINSGAVVEHDCRLGNAVHLSPGALVAGGVNIEDKAWIGLGACVRQLITIGAGSVVGMGSVVTKDVPEGATVIGNPARPISHF